MDLENIKTQTTWRDAAESINSNNLKIVTEVTKLQSATYKNKGYFKTLSDLQSAFPTAAVGSKAYVGLSYPYAIYLWQNNAWENSGATGGEESVNLEQFYTKDETDSKISTLKNETNTKLTELSAETETIRTEVESQNQLIEDLQNTKINKEADDYYPQLSVGLADNLVGTDVVDSSFSFRRSGGGAIADGNARIEAIKGNSVVWNQRMSNYNATINNNNGCSIEIVSPRSIDVTAKIYRGISFNSNLYNGHKYIVHYEINYDGDFLVLHAPIIQDGNDTTYHPDMYKSYTHTNNSSVSSFFTLDRDCIGYEICNWNIAEEITFTIKNYFLVDLTQMFGSGNEPATIEEFNARKPLGIDENAYNEGTIIDTTANSIVSRGFNQWDGEWEQGDISNATGENINSSSYWRTKNFIPVIPNEEYIIVSNKNRAFIRARFYDVNKVFLGINDAHEKDVYENESFKVPSNAHYLRFAPDPNFTSHEGLIVHLANTSHIASKNEPYISRVQSLSIVQRCFPEGIRSAIDAHDEIRYNKATQKWEKVEAIGTRAYQEGDADNASYLTDGKVTCYPLAEPIVTELEDDFNLDYEVWNGGTEKIISDVPTTPLKADIAYGFNAVGKITELSAEVGKKVDADKVATINGKSLINGGNIVIEGSSAITPDWNANEGEAGYIENKTHAASFTRIEYNQENNKGKYEAAYPVDKLLLLWGKKYFTVYKNITLTIDVNDGEDTFIVNYNGTTLFITDSYGYLKNEYEYISVSEDIIPLTEAFIPDTVIKTTPQTLSDVDKNQALANLGLTDIARKSELTELSEKIENLPSGESSVFEAIYEQTKYVDIVAAYNANKHVILKYGDNFLSLAKVTSNQVDFTAVSATDSNLVRCFKNDNWAVYSITLERTTNKTKTINESSTDAQYPSAKAVYDALQNVGGGASSDKQGVIRQTQTWTQAADKGYDYVMSNLVRGAIPQANIDLFTSAGAVFNEESGYFELNGLTDISYEEMSAIYNAGFKMVEGYWINKIRTNLFRPCNVYNVDAAQQYGFTGMYANRNCTAEVFKFTEQETYGISIKNQMYGAYDGCKYLKTFGNGVFFCQDNNISDQAFTQCFSLETIYIRNLKKNISFKDSARLSNASILYMIKQSAATSPIVITLHTDAKARAEADAEIVAALSEKTNVSLASA